MFKNVLPKYLFIHRKRYHQLQYSTVLLQAWWRGAVARRRYVTVRRGVVRAQALVRGRRARRRLATLKEQHRRRAEAQQAAAKYVDCFNNEFYLLPE